MKLDERHTLWLILAAQIMVIMFLASCTAMTQKGFDWNNADYGLTGHEGDESYDHNKR